MATIIGGLYMAVFTATEAAGAATIVGFIIVLAMRRLTWARLKTTLYETIRFTVMIMLLHCDDNGLLCLFTADPSFRSYNILRRFPGRYLQFIDWADCRGDR